MTDINLIYNGYVMLIVIEWEFMMILWIYFENYPAVC